jgi:hypothetical protein
MSSTHAGSARAIVSHYDVLTLPWTVDDSEAILLLTLLEYGP